MINIKMHLNEIMTLVYVTRFYFLKYHLYQSLKLDKLDVKFIKIYF